VKKETQDLTLRFISRMDCMKKRNGFAVFGVFIAAVATWVLTPVALSDETAIVYSVFKGIDLGNPNEMIQKDYFVNLGTNQGIRVGTVLEVARKSPSYDLTTEKLYKDLIFPFARIKVIHAEKDASIARLEKLYSQDVTPVLVPRSVIVGDLVRVSK
jgi:hypothetical protein